MNRESSVLKDSGKPAPIIREGEGTKMIEHQTARIPSSYFLGAAAGAVALSLGLAVMQERKGCANFVGQWVPSLLLLGIYNKIVKTHGSDKAEERQLH